MPSKINDLTLTRHSIDEINEHICVMNGYDRPRYYHPTLDSAGYLGLQSWATYPYKPTYASAGSGSLTVDKFYSIKVVPVNADIVAGGFPITGNATLPSIPKVSVGSDSMVFTVPVHPQTRIVLVGLATAGATGTIADSLQAWTVNQWAGYTAYNVETGVTDTIASNTATVLTLTAGTMVVADEDRYQILKSEATARYVYVAEMALATDYATADYYFVDVIPDNTTTTFELTAPVNAGETYIGERFAPPNTFTCHTSGEVLYCAGGITQEGVGTAAWLGTTETKAANTPAKTVTVIDDDYTSAGTSQILRYALASGAWTNLYEGSRVTVSSSGTAGNDVTDAKVLRVASDKSWFEIENNDGGADAADAAMVIVMTPNVIQGTSTSFSEGMVDARFEFTGDDVGSYQIAWVDTINQTLGLSLLYTGNNTATTADYRIKSTYNLYWSDYKNPHRWRSTNVVEIGDDIKALYSLGQYVIVFCEGSIWKHNKLEPGAQPQMITDEIFFDATWSVCSNGKLIMFYDGEGISATDGVSIASITGLKAENYLSQVNKELAEQIQGIYNRLERRFEFAFPMGTDTHNNYGIYITEDGQNCMPYSRPDMNVLFSGYENGLFKMYHGTSGDFSGGAGTVWQHDGVTDGLTGTEYLSEITDITGQVATVQASAAITWSAGDVLTLYPVLSGQYRQYIVESVVDNGSFEYELTFSADCDLTLFKEDDYVLYGMIPFDYGIKWTDFSSPQYLHKLARLFLDQSGMTGILWVDHFLDLDETAVQVDKKTILPTKVDIPFRKGYGYTYGFRLRGFSSTDFKINSFERVFRTKA